MKRLTHFTKHSTDYDCLRFSSSCRVNSTGLFMHQDCQRIGVYTLLPLPLKKWPFGIPAEIFVLAFFLATAVVFYVGYVISAPKWTCTAMPCSWHHSVTTLATVIPTALRFVVLVCAPQPKHISIFAQECKGKKIKLHQTAIWPRAFYSDILVFCTSPVCAQTGFTSPDGEGNDIFEIRGVSLTASFWKWGRAYLSSSYIPMDVWSRYLVVSSCSYSNEHWVHIPQGYFAKYQVRRLWIGVESDEEGVRDVEKPRWTYKLAPATPSVGPRLRSIQQLALQRGTVL